MVDVRDDVGPRQDQHVEVALEIVAVMPEPLAAKIRLGELTTLNHRPHRAIEDENALGEQPTKPLLRVFVSSWLHVFSFPSR